MPTVTIRIYEGERSGIRKLTEKGRKRVIFRFARGSLDELERLVEEEHDKTSSYVHIIESSGGLQKPYVGYSTISKGAGFGKRLRNHMTDELRNWDVGYGSCPTTSATAPRRRWSRTSSTARGAGCPTGTSRISRG